MSSQRLLARVPEAVVIGAAQLAGFEILFDKPSRDGSAKANISIEDESIVWGVAWSIHEDSWPILDGFEPGYDRIRCVIVDTRRRDLIAHAYIYRGPRTHAAALDGYIEHLITGAREHDLPRHYQRHLLTLTPAR